MNYKMKVTIKETNFPMVMDLELDCRFAYDGEQYGNGHYVCIAGKEFYKQVIDLRYDTNFDRNKKEEWLEQWAKSYWSGKNGAWAIKTLEIIKV